MTSRMQLQIKQGIICWKQSNQATLQGHETHDIYVCEWMWPWCLNEKRHYAGTIMLVDKHNRTDKLIGSKRLELDTSYNLATGDKET